MPKKRLLILILLLPFVLSDSNDPNYARVWCEYSTGDSAYGTADDICNDVVATDIPPATCVASVSNGDCLVEGNVWCFAESNCEEWGNSADGPKLAYAVNWDSNSADCSCLGETWFNNLGSSTSSALDWCCGDDGGGDDWATYSGSTTASTSINCHRCLNGGNLGIASLVGNGFYVGDLTTDQTIICYYGDITCTGGSAADGSTATRNGNGFISGNVCYYGNIGCSDGSSSHGSSCVMSASQICGDGVACFDCYTTGYARKDQYTCYSNCADDSSCAPVFTCEGVACVPKLANGGVCDEDSDCISNDCNPSADGTSYCTMASAECAFTDSSAMNVGDLDCFNNDIYRCDAENSINVFIDCASSASIDSDAGDFPLVAGYVDDTNDACVGSACTVTQRHDFCTAEDLTDYLAVGATFGTSTTNCNTEDTCVSGQQTFRDYTCINLVDDYCGFVDKDRDADISYCLNTSNACNALTWTAQGGQLNCCGDDAGSEWLTSEFDSSLNDGVDSESCCDDVDDCVDESNCYNLGDLRDIDDVVITEDTGIDTNDDEICNDVDWADQDDAAGVCTHSWLAEGETANFGGYESAAGVDTECCEDDDGEFITSELGAGDGGDPNLCCNDIIDCVDDSQCFANQSCHDTGSAASSVYGQEFCDSGFWVDQDTSQQACDCGTGEFNIGGDVALCCMDDPNEFSINETDSPLNDGGSNDDACCDRSDKCVDDNICFNNAGVGGVYYREIDEGVEYPGGTDTNDLEICDDGTIDGGLNDWHDADNLSAYCALARDPAIPGTLLQCNGSDCWIGEGEIAPFGGYENAGGIDIECCGDDEGEYFVLTNMNGACCNDTTDFVHTNLNCTDEIFKRFIYGYVMGELPDGSYAPLEHVRVVAKWESFLDVNSDFTDATGYYNITVPTYYNYTVYALKTGYGTLKSLVNATNTIQVNFSMDLTGECKQDCSRFDFGRRAYVCNRDCDNVNGCDYNDSVNSSFYGQNIKEVCHDQTLGWQEDHNATHNILCCNAGYVNIVSPISADIQLGSNVTNAHTIFAGTIYYEKEGEFYGVYVTGASLK